MKKIIVLLICICLLFSLFGCTYGMPENNDKLSVVTVLFAEYDFARAVAGDNAEVTMLLPAGSESHTYDPTPKDIIMVQSSDVFIYTGGKSDTWVEAVMTCLDEKKTSVVSMMDACDLKEEEIVDGMQEEKGEEEEENETEYDEHVWTSPLNAIKIVESIRDTFIEKDGKNASVYTQNAKSYIEKLTALHNEFKAVAENAKRKTVVFADRFPFRYFADEYGLSYYAAFPGCSSESEPAAKTVKFIIDKIKDENIPVIFTVEFSNKAIAQAVNNETCAKILLLHSCHNLTKAEFDSGVTYIDLMTQNLANIKEALS